MLGGHGGLGGGGLPWGLPELLPGQLDGGSLLSRRELLEADRRVEHCLRAGRCLRVEFTPLPCNGDRSGSTWGLRSDRRQPEHHQQPAAAAAAGAAAGAAAAAQMVEAAGAALAEPAPSKAVLERARPAGAGKRVLPLSRSVASSICRLSKASLPEKKPWTAASAAAPEAAAAAMELVPLRNGDRLVLATPGPKAGCGQPGSSRGAPPPMAGLRHELLVELRWVGSSFKPFNHWEDGCPTDAEFQESARRLANLPQKRAAAAAAAANRRRRRGQAAAAAGGAAGAGWELNEPLAALAEELLEDELVAMEEVAVAHLAQDGGGLIGPGWAHFVAAGALGGALGGAGGGAAGGAAAMEEDGEEAGDWPVYNPVDFG